MSALKVDQETVNQFGINKENDLDDLNKLGYCRAQRDEYTKVLWRERVELVIAKRQADSPDATIRAESSKNVLAKEMGIQQFVRAIGVLNELISELEPRVKATN